MTNPQRDASAPFFIVGAQRSGTTMLRLMLNAHSALCVPFESGFITEFAAKAHQYGDLSQPENAARLLDAIAQHPLAKKGGHVKDRAAILAKPIRTYADLVDAIFTTYAQGESKRYWGDKTPSYVTELDVLCNVFPNARVIHMVRDGRDVALSNLNVDWGIRSLPRAAHDWRWKTLLGHKVGALLRQNFLEIRYEDLVAEPMPMLQRICGFLGVEFEPGMLRYHESAESGMPKESMRWHRNSVRAPDESLVYAWKRRMSLADRIIFEQIAADALDCFGYERERHPSTLGSQLKNLYYATLQRW